MGLFEHFPYTNFHDLNLDVILKRVKDAEAAAAESAEDAAASAAIAQNIESIAVDAQTKANIALPLARTAEGKTAKHSFYEIIYDTIQHSVKVTDLYTGEVVSTESNPMAVYALANRMFAIDEDRPPTSASQLVDPASSVTPMIKLVYVSSGFICWASWATATYEGFEGFSIQFFDSFEHTMANISFATGGNFVYANSTFTHTGLPEIGAIANYDYENAIIICKDDKWTVGANPNPKFIVENGVLNTTFGKLGALLGSYSDADSTGCRPWVLIHLDAVHNVCATLTELYYETADTYAAYFTTTEAGIPKVYKFTAPDMSTNMTLVE